MCDVRNLYVISDYVGLHVRIQQLIIQSSVCTNTAAKTGSTSFNDQMTVLYYN
jgi:hypothetical protein